MDNSFKKNKETSLNTHEIFVRIFDKIMKKIIASKFTQIKSNEEIDFIYGEIYNILKGFDIKDKINYLLEFYNNENKNDILQFIKTKNGPKRGFRIKNKVIKKGYFGSSEKIIEKINKNKITFTNGTTAIKNSNLKLKLKPKKNIEKNLHNFFEENKRNTFKNTNRPTFTENYSRNRALPGNEISSLDEVLYKLPISGKFPTTINTNPSAVIPPLNVADSSNFSKEKTKILNTRPLGKTKIYNPSLGASVKERVALFGVPKKINTEIKKVPSKIQSKEQLRDEIYKKYKNEINKIVEQRIPQYNSNNNNEWAISEHNKVNEKYKIKQFVINEYMQKERTKSSMSNHKLSNSPQQSASNASSAFKYSESLYKHVEKELSRRRNVVLGENNSNSAEDKQPIQPSKLNMAKFSNIGKILGKSPPKITSTNSKINNPQLKLQKTIPKIKTYQAMYQLGMSIKEIRGKMTKNNFNQNIRNKSNENLTKILESNSEQENQNNTIKTSVVSENPLELTKYQKMIKAGVQKDAVILRIKHNYKNNIKEQETQIKLLNNKVKVALSQTVEHNSSLNTVNPQYQQTRPSFLGNISRHIILKKPNDPIIESKKISKPGSLFMNELIKKLPPKNKSSNVSAVSDASSASTVSGVSAASSASTASTASITQDHSKKNGSKNNLDETLTTASSHNNSNTNNEVNNNISKRLLFPEKFLILLNKFLKTKGKNKGKELIDLINGYNIAVNNNNETDVKELEKALKIKFSRTGSFGFRITQNIYKEIGGIDRLSTFLDVRRKMDRTYLLNNKVIDKETILSYFPFTDELTTSNID